MIKLSGTEDEIKQISDALHYPDHWDTAAYPTLEHAIWEILTLYLCSECNDDDEFFLGSIKRE